MLFGWQLFHKRVELLKSANQEVQKIAPLHASFSLGQKLGKRALLGRNATQDCTSTGVVITCERCGSAFSPNESLCSICANRSRLPQCSICQLPVKGICFFTPSKLAILFQMQASHAHARAVCTSPILIARAPQNYNFVGQGAGVSVLALA